MELGADPSWRQGNHAQHDAKYTVGGGSQNVSEESQIVSERMELSEQ